MGSPLALPNLTSNIKQKAHQLGFDHISFSSPQIEPDDQKAYLNWVQKGHAAEMKYLTREPATRVDLTERFPEVKSVLTVGVSYYQGQWHQKPGPGFGKVARYAWGLDYHDVILKRLQVLLSFLHDELGSASKARLGVDTQPVLERALAKSSGMGFIGKNTLLIIPKNSKGLNFHVGSWVFLGEILLDVPLVGAGEPSTSLHGCGSCAKCLSACPTSAFSQPYDLDASRCISYLTIENKGWIPRDLRAQMGDWIFGCDVCQDVCPFNARSFETRWPEFNPDQGVGGWISLKDILSVRDQTVFKEKWGHTPLSRPKRRGMIRNACVVAGNSRDIGLIPEILDLLNDPEAIVRGHTLWALSQLDPKLGRYKADRMLRNDPDPSVREEAEAIS